MNHCRNVSDELDVAGRPVLIICTHARLNKALSSTEGCSQARIEKAIWQMGLWSHEIKLLSTAHNNLHVRLEEHR